METKLMHKTAVLSSNHKYRYKLGRYWDAVGLAFGAAKGVVVFVMLNPSTADDKQDDPTIRRCIGFAKDNNYKGLLVVNLYAYRTASPDILFSVDEDIVGPENDRYITEACTGRDVICAWGTRGESERIDRVFDLIDASAKGVYCLGTTKEAQDPRHPLYVKASTKLQPYTGHER